MKTKFHISIAFLIVLNLSCSSSDDDSPSGGNPPPSSDGIVRYVNDVKPIITSNCTGCHGSTPTNDAPMSLTTYDAVKSAIQSRGLIDLISLPQGDPSMMPKNGTRLPQSSINKIIEWETDGFVNQ